MSRDEVIRSFLAESGFAGADRAPLAGDASFRHYERIAHKGRRAILMDAPPGREDVSSFVTIARHLTILGYSAPEIFAEDADAGLVLLEDLGDGCAARLLEDASDARTIYELAVDFLIDLHKRPETETVPPGLPLYDEGVMVREALLFTEWYLPAVLGHPLANAAAVDFTEAWHATARAVASGPRTLMHRDFFPDNLMLLKGRDGLAALGLLDFQDAVAGPPAYDLASLLEDARRDVDPDLTSEMLDRYKGAFPALDADAFDAAYAVLGAQRHVRVLGVFTRLCRRDGKPGYLAHIPRLWRLLENDLRHPALTPVARWIDENVPPECRVVPDGSAAT